MSGDFYGKRGDYNSFYTVNILHYIRKFAENSCARGE